MRRELSMLALLALSALCGCESEDSPSGLGEPFLVDHGAFKRGALPSGDEQGPTVTGFNVGFGSLRPGARAAQVTGNASATAYSIGIRFADLGSGYWVRPVAGLDPIAPGEFTWQLPLDADPELEPGLHELEVVAFDAAGKAGPKRTLSVCVASNIPDNNNACVPKNAPPLLVASLTWNADADLDLSIVAPDGAQFNRSKRSLSVDGQLRARLDADGLSGCTVGGRRMENFVWNEAPPATGSWAIYASLFDACGKAAVSYELTIYQRTTNADGTFALTPVRTLGGDFLRAQANGGAGSPLYLTYVDFF